MSDIGIGLTLVGVGIIAVLNSRHAFTFETPSPRRVFVLLGLALLGFVLSLGGLAILFWGTP